MKASTMMIILARMIFRDGREREGYDGAIFDNVVDRGPSGRFATEAALQPAAMFVAFDPAQIKSINNAGLRSADQRILFQGKDQGAARVTRIDFLADNKAMITLFERARSVDASP